MPIITVNNLKDHLGIGHTDATDDTNLSTAVAAAISAVVHTTGRSFEKVAVGQETSRVFYAQNQRHVDVHDIWDSTNIVVKTDEGDSGVYSFTWLAGDFFLDNSNPNDEVVWPWYQIHATTHRRFPVWGYRPQVQVTAAWGWAAVPDAVFEAALLVAARLFRRKDSPDGILGGYQDLGAIRVSQRDDPDATRLLNPFVRVSKRVLIA